MLLVHTSCISRFSSPTISMQFWQSPGETKNCSVPPRLLRSDFTVLFLVSVSATYTRMKSKVSIGGGFHLSYIFVEEHLDEGENHHHRHDEPNYRGEQLIRTMDILALLLKTTLTSLTIFSLTIRDPIDGAGALAIQGGCPLSISVRSCKLYQSRAQIWSSTLEAQTEYSKVGAVASIYERTFKGFCPNCNICASALLMLVIPFGVALCLPRCILSYTLSLLFHTQLERLP